MYLHKRFIVEPERKGFLFFKKYRFPTADEFMREVNLQVDKSFISSDTSASNFFSLNALKFLKEYYLEIRDLYRKFLWCYPNSKDVMHTIYMDIAFNPDDIKDYCIAIFTGNGIKVTLKSPNFKEESNNECTA